jgi:hypothetical protein
MRSPFQDIVVLKRRQLLVTFAALGALTGALRAATIYVDTRQGEDRFDGLSPVPISDVSGPVLTLQRAAQIADGGDTIVLANNGTPYYGSFSLVGDRHSGGEALPFEVEGNGAVISGARPVPADLWRLVGTDTWRITPIRKAFYQLILNDQAVPEIACPRDAVQLPDLPARHWCAWRGAVYYRAALGDDPRRMRFALADEEVGLTLLDVHDVVVRNVTFRHFRLDGVNAHDRCRSVVLDGVTCEQNGRAGITAAGTSQMSVFNSKVTGNRAHSVLITELGEARLDGCDLDQPPTVLDE